MSSEKMSSEKMSSEKTKERVVDLDAILEELGEFGRYQVTNYFLMFIPVVLTAFYTTSYLFTATGDEHRCWISECEAANTTEFSPEFVSSGEWVVGQCERRSPLNATGEPACHIDSLATTLHKCDKWIYKDRLSIVSEFDLGCSDWKRTLVGTINNVGQLVCLPITGVVSDRWGRRTALVLGVLMSGVLGLVRSFSPDYASFLALEFLDPALGSGVYSAAFLLAVELVGPKYRVMGGNIIAAYFSIGEVILGVVAWSVPYWRSLLRALYAPSVLLVAYFWLAPESVRWLLSNGRSTDAKKLIDRAASINGVRLSEKSMENLRHNIALEQLPQPAIKEEQIECKETFADALKSGRLMLRVICCSFMWITCTLLYYGISLSSTSLAGNIYLNFILVSLAEMPAYLVVTYTLSRFGRRSTLSSAYLMSGLACLAFAVIPDGYPWAGKSVFLGGKMCITVAFTVLYMYTTELFPTSIRHSLMATCSMAGRIGSIVAPQTPLLASISPYLPYVTFGSTALLASLLVLSFPETRGEPLPETIAEALALRRDTARKPHVTSL